MSIAKLIQKVKSEVAFYKGLAKDTEGASGIEYAIVAAMVAVIITGFSTDIGGKISTIFGSIKDGL